MTRRGDGPTGKRYLRSERLFLANGLWFFCTGEGTDQGPFRTRGLAGQAVARFTAEMVACDTLAERRGSAPGEERARCGPTGCLERLGDFVPDTSDVDR